jgi:hypothetical protein
LKGHPYKKNAEK